MQDENDVEPTGPETPPSDGGESAAPPAEPAAGAGAAPAAPATPPSPPGRPEDRPRRDDRRHRRRHGGGGDRGGGGGGERGGGERGGGDRGGGGGPGGGDRGGGDRGGGGGRGGPRQQDRRPAGPRPGYQQWQKQDLLARAVREKIDGEFLSGAVEFARAAGGGLSSDLLRGVWGELQRQSFTGLDSTRLLLLKPRLAYAAARSGRSEMRDLRVLIDRAIDVVASPDQTDEERQARFERLMLGLEAILTYQKVHERRQGERS